MAGTSGVAGLSHARVPMEPQPLERSNTGCGQWPRGYGIDSVTIAANLLDRERCHVAAGALHSRIPDRPSRPIGAPVMKFTSSGGPGTPEPNLVRGWEQCRRMLSGQDLVSDASLAGHPAEPNSNFLLMDGERHHTIRRLVISYLTRARLNSVGERLEDTCRELVRSLSGKSGVDLIADLAEPLVLDGIMSVMGVPAERRTDTEDAGVPSPTCLRTPGVGPPALPCARRSCSSGTA